MSKMVIPPHAGLCGATVLALVPSSHVGQKLLWWLCMCCLLRRVWLRDLCIGTLLALIVAHVLVKLVLMVSVHFG